MPGAPEFPFPFDPTDVWDFSVAMIESRLLGDNEATTTLLQEEDTEYLRAAVMTLADMTVPLFETIFGDRQAAAAWVNEKHQPA